MVREKGLPEKRVRGGRSDSGAQSGAQGRPRGRPPGRTERGDATRAALFEAAVLLMGEQGFEATTLRQIAAQAGVTHAVLYRYFPSKRAVVMELYRSLTEQLVTSVPTTQGNWRTRAVAATEASLEVLGPHRALLASATGVLVGVGDEGVFAPATRTSRELVQGVFLEVVAGAKDCPRGERALVLGRSLDLLHLGIILFWLLDASPKQVATGALLKVLRKALPLVQTALKLPGAWGILGRLDGALQSGLMPAPAEVSRRGRSERT